MIDSNIDPIDHPHIKGATVPGVEPLYEAIRKGTDKDWEHRAGCMTYPDAVAKVLKAKGTDPSKWLKDSLHMSLNEMKKAAAALGAGDVFLIGTLPALLRGTSGSKVPLTSASEEPLLLHHMLTPSGWRLASRF